MACWLPSMNKVLDRERTIFMSARPGGPVLACCPSGPPNGKAQEARRAVNVNVSLESKNKKCSYGTRSLLKNIRARGRIIFLFFPRAARVRAENKTNQQCHFKSSRWCMDPLGTDSCRGTVPMEPPMSNSSMTHRERIK